MKVLIFFCLLFFFLPSTIFAQHHSPSPDKDAVKTLSPVIVTAEQLDEYVKNHSRNVVVMGREEIEKRNFLEINDALDSMPGVDVTSGRSGMGARITIRGGGGSGPVSVFVDGRPINSGRYGGAILGSIPIDIVEKITVFKPPVPVWLGPGAAAGAVNIVTQDFDAKVSQKKNAGRLKINAGSYGSVNMSGAYNIYQDLGKVGFTIGGSRRDGKRTNSDKDTGRFGFDWSRKSTNQTQYGINGRYLHSHRGSPGPTDNETPDARQRYRKGSVDICADGFMGDTGEFSLKAYADMEDLDDKSQTGVTSDLDEYKIGVKGDTLLSHEQDNGATRLGAMFETNRVRHDISGNHHRENISLHVQHDLELKDFTTSLGLRVDHSDDFGYFPAINAGLSYNIGPDTLIKSNAGYSVEIPSFSQLYQPSHGSIDQVRGNSDLDEERIYSYDLSFEQKIGKDIVFNSTLFRTNTKNLINYQREIDLIYRPVNISRVYKQGVETSIKSKLPGNVSLDMCYIYLDTKNKENRNELAYSPHHNVKITLKYELPVQTRVEAIFKAVSDQYSSPDTSQSKKMDDYCVLNLKILHPVKYKTYPCEVYVHIHNLFDTDFEAHAGYPDDGFKFLAGMNVNF